MRLDARAIVAALLTAAIWASVPLWLRPDSSLVTAQATAASASRDDARAEALLARAAKALGGSPALAAVKSLRLRRHDGRIENILFPDRSQVITKRRWGQAISTLDGDRFWTRRADMPAHLAGAVTGATRSPEEVLESARRRIAWDSVKYLLRSPAHYPMEKRYAGRVTFGPASGEAVEFEASDGRRGFMVFDEATGLPKAQVIEIHMTPEVHGTHLIEELHDYQKAGDILVPLRIATYRLRSNKTETLAEWRFTVDVNPPLKKSDFREPGDA